MPEQHPYDDKALFLAISQGDEASFTELFHSYTPKLLAFLIKITRNEHIARELAQETLIQIWVNRKHLQNVEKPSTYLLTMARNLANDYFRKEYSRRRMLEKLTVETSPFADTVEVITAKEVSGIIAEAVNALPAKQQEVYRLSREQGMSHEQIAAHMGISVSTVNNQIGTALRSLAGMISQKTGLSVAVTAILLSL